MLLNSSEVQSREVANSKNLWLLSMYSSLSIGNGRSGPYSTSVGMCRRSSCDHDGRWDVGTVRTERDDVRIQLSRFSMPGLSRDHVKLHTRSLLRLC
jgi:hypothetical protein